MALDFRRADHLPNARGGREPFDPAELPRQRRGTTPQMHGRYPDFDVLSQADHWDENTSRLVLSRVEEVPPLRFFDAREAATLKALCDVLTDQDSEPRIPVLSLIDAKLHEAKLDGFQYDGMPDDRDAWRLVAQGLDERVRAGDDDYPAAETFAAADPDLRCKVVEEFAAGKLHDGAWKQLDCERAFSVVMRGVAAAFYSHPWAWNEIGFGGPAYPRGYSRFGSPHLQTAEREPWEGREAYDRDPVRNQREAPP